MNFFCSTKKNTNSFQLSEHNINGNYIYLDEGWSREDDYFFKGISSSWCKIYFNGPIRIETNKFRDFPIYHNGSCLSNFKNLGNVISVDGLPSINKGKVNISYVKDFYPKIPNDPVSFKECKDILYDAVIENVGIFAANNKKPVMMPDQNGVDTLLTRSAFDYIGVDYKLFTLDGKPKVSSLGNHLAGIFWGFAQVPEYNDKVVVGGGFYGDEWILRNPYYAHILLDNHGISLEEEFDSMEDCYMKKYFESYRKKCSVKNKKTKEDVLTQMCNDFQIWHLNNTTFLSPLKHESLLTLFAADSETILSQVTNATLSKAVIESLNPNLLEMLDEHKNQNDPNFFHP
jgi:hypothetical protein